MTDIVDKKTRSRMMSGIKGKDTKPELVIRSALHKRGFRFCLHVKELPGKPDLVFPRYKSVVFVHGCFWHGHGCHLFKWPKTRKEFWRKKIDGNKRNDDKFLKQLIDQGWRVLIIWECAIKGSKKRDLADVIAKTEHWLYSDCSDVVSAIASGSV